MSKPIRTVRIATSPASKEAVRRWREGHEVSNRDNRPGHYSVTGEFIVLPDPPAINASSAKHGKS
jgi:hypothetical protein